jgi:hypothetical protein
VNKLAAMYNLSPEAAAQLAQVAGQQPDPLATPALDAVKQYVPGATAEAAAAGNPIVAQAKDLAGTPVWKRAEEMGRSIASSGALGGVPALLVKPPPPEAPKPGAAADTTPQGPETDSFPTVRTDYGGGGGGAAAPAGAGTVVPAHWTHQSAKEGTEGYRLDPTALESMGVARDSAAGHQLMAADHRLKAATIDAQAEAVSAQEKERAKHIGAEQLAALQTQRDQYIKDQLGKLQTLATQAQTKVDPNQIWKGEQGSLARVWTAVMMGLNQFAVMWRGKGSNAAMQIVNDAINRSVDAQKSNAANAANAYQLQSNLYAQNLQAFGDKERAVLATRINHLDSVQNMLDMKRAEAKGELADAAYEDMTAKVQTALGDARKEFLDLTKVKSTEEVTDKYLQASVVGGGGEKGKDPLYVPTLGGYARDEQTARALNNKGALRMQMTENMRQIHGLMEKAKKLNSAQNFRELQDIQERIDGLVNDTLTKNTVIEGQGAMSKDDKAVSAAAKSLNDISVRGTLNSNIDRQQKRVWDAATRILEHHRLDGEANGIQIGREVYRQGPTGPVPVRELAGRNKTVSKNTEAYDDVVSPPKGVPQK